jgi:ABC-type multidrug transport system ATPase subunit
VLEARGLTKRYSGLLALDRVSFTLQPGEMVGYLGPNGSGKSTTVNIIVGLLEPSSGTVSLDGQTISQQPTEYKRRIGYVPEEPYLYTHLTAPSTSRSSAGFEASSSVGSCRRSMRCCTSCSFTTAGIRR